MTSKPLAIYYEHPEWFLRLFAELDARGVNYLKLDASCAGFDPSETGVDFSLFFNRMSASAHLRGHTQGIFFTHSYLTHLEANGVPMINGSTAFAFEISKARQLQLFRSLGLAFPKTRIVNCVREILAVASGIGFPLLVKPNIGGRGAGITQFDSLEELHAAIDAASVDLGIDGTALVQELIPKRERCIARVETLGGKFLYAIKIYTDNESFNLCPAEICQKDRSSADPRLNIEAYSPPKPQIAAVERLMAAAQIDVGGAEYMIDDRDGRVLFYDLNVLSNFVADAPRIIGFDPHVRLVDFLESKRRE